MTYLLFTIRDYRKEQATMKKHMFLSLLKVGGAFGLLSVMASLPVRQAHAQGNTSMDFVPPIVFQAAGPTVESIQGTVEEFRTTLGNPNNGNAPGQLAGGHREINWDGGSTDNQNTAVVGNPFAGF